MCDNRLRVAVVGRGAVASHIRMAVEVNDNLIYAGTITREYSSVPDADIYIVSVSDDAISEVTNRLSELLPNSSLVAHTSGSKSISEISDYFIRRAVMYPFQTFTKGVEIDMSKVPIFIECSDDNDNHTLELLGREIAGDVYKCDSLKRRSLHIMGVFSCNFTNHLLSISQIMAHEEGFEFKVLEPLIRESFRKAISADDISKVQTGPASRGDIRTIEQHIELLQKKSSEYIDIYRVLTNSIMNSNG